MSNIASIMSEFDDIEHLMYMNTNTEGKYIYDGILSLNNESKDKGLLCQYEDWIILLQMEEELIQMTEAIICQIRDDKNKKNLNLISLNIGKC